MKVKTITLVLAMLTVSVGLWGQQDPLIGTWKLNLAKSKFSPRPAPRSTLLKYEPSGNNAVKVTFDTVDAKGSSARGEYTATYDGKEYPVKGVPEADMASMKRIDSSTTERTWKKAGKVTNTAMRVVSKDGKTLTITSKGTNAQGQPVNDVEVYDKQ